MITLACTVSQESLTKNVIIQSTEGKKIRQIQGRIRMRRLVHNPMIQYIIINLHIKYDYSSLQSFTKIFDENLHYSNYEKKENWTNAGKNKHEKAGLHPTIQYIYYHPAYDHSSLHDFTEIFDEKFYYLNYRKKENWTNTGKNRHEKADLHSLDIINHVQLA